MQIAIVIYSKTGTTRDVAEVIGSGIRSVNQTDYQIMSVEEIDKDYVEKADAVIFGTPTYYANISWQMKKWLDEGGVNLGGKLAGVFSTANVQGGGSETALLTLINHLLVKGMLIYSSGSACGAPFIHLGATYLRELPMEKQEEKLKIFGQRMAEKANQLFNK